MKEQADPAGEGVLVESGEVNKTLDVTSSADLNKDVKIFGDPDVWQLICKASSEKEGWMKSTKMMDLPTAVVIQVTTQQRNPDGSWSVAEALTSVPKIVMPPKPSNVIKPGAFAN